MPAYTQMLLHILHLVAVAALAKQFRLSTIVAMCYTFLLSLLTATIFALEQQAADVAAGDYSRIAAVPVDGNYRFHIN